MSQTVKRFLFWTPRVLGLLFAAFISMFAFDVFGEGYGFWGTVWALLVHLVPTALVLIAVAIAWRREWVGALLFFLLGLAYIVVFRGDFDWIAYLMIAGPLFLIGLLFLLNWRFHQALRMKI